jgi:hypothetical protein
LADANNIEGIFADTVYRRSGKEDFREEIMAELDKKPARTLGEAAGVIEEVSGLKRSLPQVMKFLKNGFSPLKAGFLPAKTDNVKQKAFVEDKLKPLIFFVAASHFVMGGFAGMLRCHESYAHTWGLLPVRFAVKPGISSRLVEIANRKLIAGTLVLHDIYLPEYRPDGVVDYHARFFLDDNHVYLERLGVQGGVQSQS